MSVVVAVVAPFEARDPVVSDGAIMCRARADAR
jgi:hypothetical protein